MINSDSGLLFWATLYISLRLLLIGYIRPIAIVALSLQLAFRDGKKKKFKQQKTSQ